MFSVIGVVILVVAFCILVVTFLWVARLLGLGGSGVAGRRGKPGAGREGAAGEGLAGEGKGEGEAGDEIADAVETAAEEASGSAGGSENDQPDTTPSARDSARRLRAKIKKAEEPRAREPRAREPRAREPRAREPRAREPRAEDGHQGQLRSDPGNSRVCAVQTLISPVDPVDRGLVVQRPCPLVWSVQTPHHRIPRSCRSGPRPDLVRSSHSRIHRPVGGSIPLPVSL